MAEVLRTMELMREMLEEVLHLRSTTGGLETAKRLGDICVNRTGLPLDLIKSSAPNDVLRLLGEGGAMQPIRAIMIAEILLADAELNQTEQRIRNATIERAQALALIAAVIDRLSLEDQPYYRSKMEMLRVALSAQSNV